MDKPRAVTAAVHKLARLIFAMLTHGQEYTDRGAGTPPPTRPAQPCQDGHGHGMPLVPSDNTA